jgi:hypothetical protein
MLRARSKENMEERQAHLPMSSPKRNRFRQWLSIQVVKRPRRIILFGIVLFNLLFFLVAGAIISHLAPASLKDHGFWASVYYTITMVLDAGCIANVIEDVGSASVAIIIACLVVVVVGMVTFTGCVVGYVTNMISNFIDTANAGTRKLELSDHTVILNWNNRASEIINDLLYSEHRERIVVLVNGDKEAVEAEIDNRLADTLARENKAVQERCRQLGYGKLRTRLYCRHHRFENRLTVLVRRGDTFSTKQLMDISLDRARTVILLNQDIQSQACRYAGDERRQAREKGNPVTIKTLVLVAEITAAESSADDQKIIVEVDDPWTEQLVAKIIAHKEKLGKCNIIPVSVNQILGQLLSQFSVMPQLNLVYNELFSNRGAEFYAKEIKPGEQIRSREAYLADHFYTVPLTQMKTKSGEHCFFMADLEADVDRVTALPVSDYRVKLNPSYWQPRRNVLILGHNSKLTALMDGFQSYHNEWNPASDGRDILNITVVDDSKSLEKMDYFRAYPYVSHVIEADVYDRETIYAAINAFIDDEDGDTGILILSDDSVDNEDLDASALTYLIYVQDVLSQRRSENGGVDTERIDVVIEILNPKNDDVVRSYNVNNVVISNRYISKMITQIGEKDALFEFYSDILTYDEAGRDSYTSMELYIKRVGDFFAEIPAPCDAAQLIRTVYAESLRLGADNVALVLGYLDAEDHMTLFSGRQTDIKLQLGPEDKLILFSNH